MYDCTNKDEGLLSLSTFDSCVCSQHDNILSISATSQELASDTMIYSYQRYIEHMSRNAIRLQFDSLSFDFFEEAKPRMKNVFLLLSTSQFSLSVFLPQNDNGIVFCFKHIKDNNLFRHYRAKDTKN
jgi:hypothetical protein